MKHYFVFFIFCISQLFYCSEHVNPYSTIVEQRYRDAEIAMKSYEAQYTTFQHLTTDEKPHPLESTEIQSIHEQHQESMQYENFPLREKNTLTAISIAAYFKNLFDEIQTYNRKISQFRNV